eukprot:gene2674-3242_t
MSDSNQFHAICLDTFPPIFYMNDVSRAIIKLVHAINADAGKVIAAYTFDAGPNAVIYTLDQHVPLVLAVMGTYFPPPGRAEEYCNNAPLWCASVGEARVRITPELSAQLSRTGLSRKAAGDVKYVFVTKAGPGPTRQS